MNKTSIIQIFLSLLFYAGTVFSGEDFEAIEAKGGLRIAVYQNFPPYSFKQGGKTVGIDVDIAKAIADRLQFDALIWSVGADENMEDDLRNVVWKGHYLGGGTADFMMHVPFDEEFAEENDKVVIFAPYAREKVVIVRNKSVTANEPVMQTFLKGKIGVELDTMPDFYLSSAGRGMYRNNIRHYMTVNEAVEKLLDGKLRSVVAPKAQIEAALAGNIAQYDFSDLSVSGRVRSTWDLGIAVKEGRTELIDAIKVAMAELKESGQVQKIYSKYGIDYLEADVALMH